MKLLPHEQKRLVTHARLSLALSADIRPEVTKKSLLDFIHEVGDTLRQKRQVKNWIVVLVEIDKERK